MKKEFENNELIILNDENLKGLYIDKRNETARVLNFDKNGVISEIKLLIEMNFSKETYEELREWFVYEVNINEEILQEILIVIDEKINLEKDNFDALMELKRLNQSLEEDYNKGRKIKLKKLLNSYKNFIIENTDKIKIILSEKEQQAFFWDDKEAFVVKKIIEIDDNRQEKTHYKIFLYISMFMTSSELCRKCYCDISHLEDVKNINFYILEKFEENKEKIKKDFQYKCDSIFEHLKEEIAKKEKFIKENQ